MSDAELKRLVQEAKKNESKIQANIKDKKRKELEAFEREWNLLIGPSGKMTIRQRSAEGGAKKKSKKKSKKKTKKVKFSIKKSKKQTIKKAPTSLSIFPDKSPQLQEPGVPTKLTSYTTKNVAIRDERGREYNAIINDRLAYRRAPRGQNVDDFSEILYGPKVVQLTSQNYRKVKKGSKLYYDRGSAALRGPFIFKNLTRGPELLMEVKDTAYNKTYLFSIAVNRLDKEKVYLILGNKSISKSRKMKSKSKRSNKTRKSRK
jgi:hypothetical protein